MATLIFKQDNLRFGLVLGLIGPVLGLLIIYYIKFDEITFGEFVTLFLNSNKLITSIGSLSLLANVVLFTVYVNTNRDKTAKGIFILTLIFGISILLLKLLNK